MSKGKLYKIDNEKSHKEDYVNDRVQEIVSISIELIVYAIVLVIASNLFVGIYVKNFLYAILASFIISILNYTIKPALVWFTLPITISTLGILYPLSNMIILWICSLIMGNNFVVHGIFSLFFISIFISAFKLLLDKLLGVRK